MAETKFKIYSLMVVKNEADVIEANLMDACRWSDKIIVLDNGSTDGTWEKVQLLRQSHPQIIAYGQDKHYFHIGLRAKLFRQYRKEMHLGDWWCVRLDADEFYADDVRQFLSRVPWYCNTVAKSSYDYIPSQDDLPLLTGDFTQDKAIIHHLLPEHRRERRFVRHSPWLIWLNQWRYPHPLGRVFEEGIHVNHYQYRSAQQMQLRWQTRHDAKQQGCGTFKHENNRGWEQYLWENLPQDIEWLFHNATHVLKTGRNEIRETDNIVIKSFAVPTGIRQIVYSYFQKSKARRSYEYALRLKGITPQPIAYKENKRHGLLTQSFYACQMAEGTHTMRDLIVDMQFPNRDIILQAVGRTIARMHQLGAYHKDLSQGNILFDEDGSKIDIIDLNRIVWRRHLSPHRRWRNFSRLKLDNAALRTMVYSYAQEMKDNPEEATHFVQTHRWHKLK